MYSFESVTVPFKTHYHQEPDKGNSYYVPDFI